MQNYNQQPLPAGLKEQLIKQFSQIREQIPTPPLFSPAERKIIQAMNETRKPFVEKALVYGGKVSKIVPPFVNIEELSIDLLAFADYAEIVKEFDLLGKKLRDLMFAAGADCYNSALAIYNSAKLASRNGMSEAKPIVDDLKSLFEKEYAAEELPKTNTPG